jgi:hypothetical protein
MAPPGASRAQTRRDDMVARRKSEASLATAGVELRPQKSRWSQRDRNDEPVINETDPVVQFKLSTLRAAMPAKSAIVFGDMYIVEGSYTAKCLEYGCERVVLVDSLETPGWLQTRLADGRIDFFKGDFSNAFFMQSIRERYSVSVVFDILLHQPPLLSTLHMMLEKTEDAIAIVQPVLKERDTQNTLVYLPGQPRDSGLYPLAERSHEYLAFDVEEVNQSHWIWGMTPSFIRSALAGEGFEIVHEDSAGELENPQWMWWGCVARRSSENPHHWSQQRPTQGLFAPSW